MEDNSQPKSAAQSALSISEAAHRNHEEWFPLHKSTLKITDPDLILFTPLMNSWSLLTVITQLLPWVGYPRTLNAWKCLNEVMPK